MSEQRPTICYGMMPYPAIKQGIDNTNAHLYRWLAGRPNTASVFVDFQHPHWLRRMRAWIRERGGGSSDEVISQGLTYRLTCEQSREYRYAGIETRHLASAIKKISIHQPEIWSFNPFDRTAFDLTDANLRVFYAVDDWRHNAIFTRFHSRLTDNYRYLGTRADVVFTTSQRLVDDFWRDHPNAYRIPNAVDTEHFQRIHPSPRIDSLLQPFATSKPKVAYVGVITPQRVDAELVEYLVRHNPDLTFIFAGPVWQGFPATRLQRTYSNIHFIGLIYYPEMPYFYSLCDVCIIPHQRNEFTDSMDPKKLYEYLAAGKPVVATPVAGTIPFQKAIHIAENAESFQYHVRQALVETSAAQVKQRQDALAPHTWSQRFSQLGHIINRYRP